MGGRDLVEMKCADPSDAPATCHNTQHTQFGIPPIPLHLGLGLGLGLGLALIDYTPKV